MVRICPTVARLVGVLVLIAAGSAHAQQCPASTTITADYFASVGNDGSGPAVRGPGDAYDTMGTVLRRAIIVGFDLSAVSSLCRVWKVRYLYATRERSHVIYTYRGLLGGDGRPTGNLIDDLNVARTGVGLSSFAVDPARSRIQRYLVFDHIDAVDQRVVHGEYLNLVLQPTSGPNTGWVQIYTPWAGSASNRPKITLWLEPR